MSRPSKSPAYVEAMIREAVAHVEACIRTPLADLGYAGPAAVIHRDDLVLVDPPA